MGCGDGRSISDGRTVISLLDSCSCCLSFSSHMIRTLAQVTEFQRARVHLAAAAAAKLSCNKVREKDFHCCASFGPSNGHLEVNTLTKHTHTHRETVILAPPRAHVAQSRVGAVKLAAASCACRKRKVHADTGGKVRLLPSWRQISKSIQFILQGAL